MEGTEERLRSEGRGEAEKTGYHTHDSQCQPEIRAQGGDPPVVDCDEVRLLKERDEKALSGLVKSGNGTRLELDSQVGFADKGSQWKRSENEDMSDKKERSMEEEGAEERMGKGGHTLGRFLSQASEMIIYRYIEH